MALPVFIDSSLHTLPIQFSIFLSIPRVFNFKNNTLKPITSRMNYKYYPNSYCTPAEVNDALEKLSTIDLWVTFFKLLKLIFYRINYSIQSEKCKNDVNMMTNPRKVKLGIQMHHSYFIEICPDENCLKKFKKSHEIYMDTNVGEYFQNVIIFLFPLLF